MGTLNEFVHWTHGRLASLQDLKDRFFDYLQGKDVETLEILYPSDGTWPPYVTITADGADKIQLTTDTMATDGAGHRLDTLAALVQGLQFENTNAIVYYVGLHYTEIPDDVQINPRTGDVEYISYLEYVGEDDNPDSVTDLGSLQLKLVVDSVTEAGVSNAGRKVWAWLEIPVDPVKATAIQEKTVQWDGSNNYVVVDLYLGQGTPSLTASDYRVALKGPSIKRNTDLSTHPAGYVYIGKVTGAGSGNPPTTFDMTGQNHINFSFLNFDEVFRTSSGNHTKIQVKSFAGETDEKQIEVLDPSASSVFSVDEDGDLLAKTVAVTSPSGSNLNAITGTGDGTGEGVTGIGGASGNGVAGVASGANAGVTGAGGATNGTGVAGAGGGNAGIGVQGTAGGTSGVGVKGIGGTTGGYGVWGEVGSSANGAGGVRAVGNDGYLGLYATGGGNGAAVCEGAKNAPGVRGTGGETLVAVSPGDSAGVRGTGGLPGVGGTAVDASCGGYFRGLGDGAGAYAVAAGNGYGVWAEADTTSPARAAIRCVPQNANPTTPLKGDIYAKTGGSDDGALYWYDGTVWRPAGVLRSLVTLSPAQILALNTTPITLVAAPGAGNALRLNRAVLIYDFATTPYAITPSGDLVIRYTGTGGAIASEVFETTGFLDQSADRIRTLEAILTGCFIAANAPLVIHNIAGAFTSGDSPVRVYTEYSVFPTGL